MAQIEISSDTKYSAPEGRTETDKTSETYPITNDEFLRTIFSDLEEGTFPALVGFRGHPKDGNWSSRAWILGEQFDSGANNYFSLAAFRRDEDGGFRRRKKSFSALYAIMLDDVGTKVPRDRLTLEPTWLLETSPGNFQAGFIPQEPISDGDVADELVEAVISAGLSDKGANGPCARLARLPVGSNGKSTPSFQCGLVAWNPEFRYSIEDLVVGLGLEMNPKGDASKGHTKRSNRPGESEGAYPEQEEVWTPTPPENPVLRGLKEKGLYKSPLGPGKHDITCPWVTEHTGCIDSGTVYFEPDEVFSIGGFKCQHGHCADRKIRALLEHLEIDPGDARMKAKIRIIGGEIHRIVDAAERELCNLGRFYQRAGLVVTIATDPGTRETLIQEVSQPALTSILSGAAIWLRFASVNLGWVRIDPPSSHVRVLHSLSQYRHLPVLLGISRQPYLRPDHTLMVAPGYDAATGMYGEFNISDFSVPMEPSREDAEVALGMLNELLSEFAFLTESDRSAALSAILTASIRPGLKLAPMFHVKAHMVGSGKSYLCQLITAFVTPKASTPTTFPADDEECRKLLLSEFLKSPAVIEFDNLTSDLVAHKSLCTALTSEFMTGRILGVSKTANVSTRSLFLSSGNNVGPVQDMARRCITIRLSPQCEVPAAREFKRPDLIREVLGQRGRYVSAALTVIRAWIVAGAPKTQCKPLGSFGDWSDLCRQPLLWLGFADPTDSVFEAMAEDPDRETLGRLMDAWEELYGSTGAMIRDALNSGAYGNPKKDELIEILREIGFERGDINRRKLGWWFKRNSGRIVDGRRLVRTAGNSSAEKWRVERVEESVSPVLSVLSVLPRPNEAESFSDELPF